MGLGINHVVLLLHQVLKKTNQCIEIGYCYYMGLVESYVVLLLDQVLEIIKSVLGNRVLLLHGFGGKICSIVATDFENKSVPRNRVLLLHEFGGELCSIVTRSGFRNQNINAGK
jgi:hypothetical protein